MRCGCPDCGAYRVHADGPELGCVCPQCGRHCRDCLGLSAPLSREQLHDLARQPGAFEGFFALKGGKRRQAACRGRWICGLSFHVTEGFVRKW